MRWPTKLEPVNAILSTSSCLTSTSPQVGPKPERMLTTPGGNPASVISLPIYAYVCVRQVWLIPHCLPCRLPRASRQTICVTQDPTRTYHQPSDWRLLRGLHDDSVATCKGWCELPRLHNDGEIPWNDLTHHTDGLVSGVAQVVAYDIHATITSSVCGSKCGVREDKPDRPAIGICLPCRRSAHPAK